MSHDVPHYRKIPTEFAYDTNGYIPAGFNMVRSGIVRLGNLGMDLRIPLRDSIGAIADMIAATKEGKGLYYPCDRKTSDIVKSQLHHAFPGVVNQIILIHQMDIPSVKDTPNQVINRILDWALEPERAGI